MLSRERNAGRTGFSQSRLTYPGVYSQWKREHSCLGRSVGRNLPLDETKRGERCAPRSRAGSLEPREELLISDTSQTQGVDRRKPKRRRSGDVSALELSPGEAEFREGLAHRQNVPEGLRRKKESISRIASADVPLAVGTDLGNKRRQRTPPGEHKETGGSRVEKESNASQSAAPQGEENERRSERLKERKYVERKKTFEESHSIDWQAIRFGPGRRTKPSGRKQQQKGKRGKTRVQAKIQVKRPWSHDTEKGMSPDERHDDRGSGQTWTSRLRERGKKRVLEFCSEVEVEAFAANPRVVKQKTEKEDKTLEGTALPSAEDLDDLLVLRWSRRNPRKTRTRSRFPNLAKEPQAENVGEPCEVEINESMSMLEDEQREGPTAAARKTEQEDPESLQAGFLVSEELPDSAVPESAGKVSSPAQEGASGACEPAEPVSSDAAGIDRVRSYSSLISNDEMQERQVDGQTVEVKMSEVELSTPDTEEVEGKSDEAQAHEKFIDFHEKLPVGTVEGNALNSFTDLEAEVCRPNNEEVVNDLKPTGLDEDASQEMGRSCTDRIRSLSYPEASLQIGAIELTHVTKTANDEQMVSDEFVKKNLVETVSNSPITTEDANGSSCPITSRETASSTGFVVKEHAIDLPERETLVELRSNEIISGIEVQRTDESQENVDVSKISEAKTLQGQGREVCYATSSLTATTCEVPEEQVLIKPNSSSRCEISDGKMVLAAATNVYEVTELSLSDGREHGDANVLEFAEVKVAESSKHGQDLSLESGDESSSGNSDEEKEGPRKIEESSGNSVDDFDVLAKYCLMKPRDKDSLSILERSVSVMLEGGVFEHGSHGTMETSGQDADPVFHELASNEEKPEAAEEKTRKDLQEIPDSRLQSLLDVVRIEASITPEMADSSDSRELEESHQVLDTVQMTDAPRSPNAFIVKERTTKYSNDFKRGFASLGLKCALCGGSSDGKWACELRSARKLKARDASNYATPKTSRIDVKESGKMQVKKGWLGRLLGPLSARAGVAGMWVHELCAVWSPEVYFAGVGRLKNVKAAIRRGRLLKCSYCGQPGATIGCRVDRCPQNYHLPCAHFDGCSFDDKKYLVACSEHLHLFPSRCRRIFESGNDVQTHQAGERKQSSKLHRGNFRKMMIERRNAASTARLKDLEEEEKFMERSGEDEEFARRERKRLQRDLAKIVPTKLGARKSENEEVNIFEGWNSVAGLQDVIKCLKEMVILPLLYPGAFDRLGIVPPRGVLLHGHSGTGKTLVVRALAGACAKGSEKISYFARKGADCLGKYVGDAERQLRLLFQVAEQHQPSIIFFDEIDGLAPSRSRDGQDQTHSSVVSTLLALMDGLSSRGSVIVIGATNRPDALDPALRRPGRFDREIYFPLPSVADRAAILALHTRSWVPRPATEDLSAVAKATRGFAGADLQALCTEVALKALKRVAPVHRLMEFAEERGTKSLPPLPSITVKASDWARALKEAPPPCSMRMASAALSHIAGSPLPWYLVPSLLPALVEVFLQLNRDGRCFMPPALLKGVSSAAAQLQSVEQRRKSSELRSQYKSVSVLDSGSDQLHESVEAALTSAGLVGSGVGVNDSGYVTPPCGQPLPGEPPISDVDSPAVPAMIDMPGCGRKSHFRVLISGKGKRGQRLVGASIIAGFEGFSETRTLNLPTMLHEGDGNVVLGLSRIIGTGNGSTPLLFFMPQIESWCVVREDVDEESPMESKSYCEIKGTSEPGERSEDIARDSSVLSASDTWNVFLQHIKCLSSDTSFMFLATSHLSLDELPSKVVDFFLSSTESSGDKHLVYKNQPVPCALVELHPLKNRMSVVERASQDISRSLAARFVRYVNHRRESLEVNDTGAASELTNRDSPSDEQPKVLTPSASSGDDKQCSADAVEGSLPQEQVSSSPVAEPAEPSKLIPHSPDTVLKADNSVRGPLEESSVGLLDPRNSVDSWSSEKKALQLAIAQFSHYMINQSQFSDLRRISASIKSGPCLNTSLIDPRIFETANHSRSISLSASNKAFEDILDKRDEKSTNTSQVYGLEAVGLKGKGGLYASGKEFGCDISAVLSLVRERIRSKVEGGRDQALYVPLLSKISGLEDIVSSWLYQIRRLEDAVEVLRDVQEVAQNDRTGDLSQPTPCEAGLASLPSTPESSAPKLSPSLVPEKLGAISAKNFQSDDQNTVDTRSSPHGISGDGVADSLNMDAGASALDHAEGGEGAPGTSDKLAGETAVANGCSQHHAVEDRHTLTSDVQMEASFENHQKPDSRNGEEGTECEDKRAVSGHEACISGDGACHLSSDKKTPSTSRVHLRSQSLPPLRESIQDMILAACNEHSVESVEHLHEVIARCAASVRSISDKLLRKVDWTSGYHDDACCPVRSERAQEVLDGHGTEVCLCLLTEAVQKLTVEPHQQNPGTSNT